MQKMADMEGKVKRSFPLNTLVDRATRSNFQFDMIHQPSQQRQDFAAPKHTPKKPHTVDVMGRGYLDKLKQATGKHLNYLNSFCWKKHQYDVSS